MLPVLQRDWTVEVLETRGRGHARARASELASTCTHLIAAGGDGTVHEVVNGLLEQKDPQRPLFGILPLGSGNDLARTLGFSTDPQALLYRLQHPSLHLLDIGRIDCVNAERAPVTCYFANACSTGMGPDVLARLERKSARWSAGLRYFISIVESFLWFKPVAVRASAPDFQLEEPVRVLAIANGRSFGNGLIIAPDAQTHDRKFHVFIAGAATLLDFLRFQGALKKGKKIHHPLVHYATTTQMELTGEAGLEADGEWVGYLPATIRLAETQLRLM